MGTERETLAEAVGLLKETSIVRLFSRLKEGEPFAILTPYRYGERSWARNRELYHELGRCLSELGLSHVQAVGPWTYTDDKTGEEKKIIEPNFVIYGIGEREAEVLAQQYDQDGFVWGIIGEGVWVIDNLAEGGYRKIYLGDQPTSRVINDGYTQLRTHKFTFRGSESIKCEGLIYKPDNQITAMGWDSLLEKALRASYGSKVDQALEVLRGEGSLQEAVAVLLSKG